MSVFYFASIALVAAAVPPPGLLGQRELPALTSEADTKAAVARLRDEKTRMEALEQLIDLGSIHIFRVGSMYGVHSDPKKNALAETAAKEVAKCRNLETVRKALFSSRHRLQFWALWNINSKLTDPNDPWMSLLPRIRELATRGDGNVRHRAQSRLRWVPTEKAFLARCVKEETSLSNILSLVNCPDKEEFNRRMEAHALRLLAHPELEVRARTMSSIGANYLSAPACRFSLSSKVFDRALELTHSRNSRERDYALFALTELRHHDREAIRKRVADLMDDEAEEVRARICWVISDQQDRSDIQALYARLLRDKSATVRISAIWNLGLEKHVEELKEIAAGADKEAAESAASMLAIVKARKAKKE